MKQKDIALILVIAIISGIISFLVSNKIFVTANNRQQTVEIVGAINSDFSLPDSKYFNKQSVDPAQTIEVGENNNQNPFNGTGQ